VITIEDPVEVRKDRFVQMEVNEKAGITYGEGLRAILRHDPDVMMIGEIRDAETAQIAVRAAMTGHLVLSTLHTIDSFGCVYRLMEFGVPLPYMKQTLKAVVAQRLMSLLCPYCGPKCRPECRLRRKRRRLGVYEILAGATLNEWLDAVDDHDGHLRRPALKTIKDMVKRGVACGYLSEESFIQT
jgi:competence protein ComGA